MTDEEIINSIKMGNSAGLNELYQLNLRSIINHVKMNNGREDDAKDIFQEVIIDFREKVILNRFILSSSAKIKTYLFEACKYKWLNELRRRNKMSPEEVPDIAGEFWEEYDDKRELNERQSKFKEGMMKLGDRCRRILQYYCDRVPMTEIAARLGFDGGEQVAKNEKAKCQKKLIEIVQNHN
jgi:RNA polymerase sigma factor (sigma-70 family)